MLVLVLLNILLLLVAVRVQIEEMVLAEVVLVVFLGMAWVSQHQHTKVVLSQ
jgi:hypothetical protein